MVRRYRNKTPRPTDYELKQCEWWLSHHKGNVQYLCIRIAQYLEAKETGDEKFLKFFEGHFRSTLPAFAESVGLDLEWEDE